MTFMTWGVLFGASLALVAAGSAPASAQTVLVQNADQLRQAVRAATPGTTIKIASGTYPGGFYFDTLRGTRAKPITITAASQSKPPVFQGGVVGMQIARPAYLTLQYLTFRGQSDNGLNIDDGGDYRNPARNITLRGITVADVGPQGNHDGIKISGVTDFRLLRCNIVNVSGQAIDMVGCHRGLIENCRIASLPDEAAGIQAKGGTSNITVRRCRFDEAGARAVNIGGSTGLEYFRPPLSDQTPPFAEARNITVEGCTFVGAVAPIAFVGVDGALVRFNTFYRPRRWAMRILQETRAEGFVPCRNGVYTDNLIVFQSSGWAENGVNIGDATAPDTFAFARNVWYCEDRPDRSQPGLPTAEVGGIYGQDPRLINPAAGDFRPAPDGPGARAGATALP